MNKFLRKNNKKLLAIFGVFLMIAFVVQTRFNPSSGGRGATLIGRIGDENIIESDLENSRQQWRLLKQALVIESPAQSGQYRSFLGSQFAPAQAIEQDPKLYLLLQKEADRMGTNVSDQEVQEFLTNPQIDIQMPTGSIARFDQMQSTDPDYATDVREATAGFLRVAQASNRALDLCKFSRPFKDFALAEDHQNISVRMAILDATKRGEKIALPTTQDLGQQFEQFANVPPSGIGSAKNPMGLGYRIPDELRLQTIAVSRSQLKEAVSKSKSDYDWDVLARSYYLKHRADFPATRPVTPPPESMVTLPVTQPAATTKPYDQVRAEIMDKVMAPDMDDLSDKVQQSIAAALAQDWTAYHAAHPGTQPATGPAQSDSSSNSSLGVPYDSYDYLKSLALRIQTEFNLLPETTAYNKPLSFADLSKLPGIGQAHTAAGSSGTTTNFDAAATDPSLAVLQPSAPLQDDASTVYLFRVTERIPAHAPASIADVADTVKSDWLKAEAYRSALKAASALRDAAIKTTLASAAATESITVTTTPPFSASSGKGTEAIPGVPLTGDDVDAFRRKCQSILQSAAKHEPPVAVVEAPNESKVLVIELADVQPDWPKGQRYIAEADVTRELMSEFARPLQQEWFTLQGVEARLGYTDLLKDKSAG